MRLDPLQNGRAKRVFGIVTITDDRTVVIMEDVGEAPKVVSTNSISLMVSIKSNREWIVNVGVGVKGSGNGGVNVEGGSNDVGVGVEGGVGVLLLDK